MSETKKKEFKLNKNEEEWKKELSEEEYHILREKGTERSFSGKYDNHFEEGTYLCTACNEELFTSDSKFDAGCGWPSFDQAASEEKITSKDDHSMGSIRTEIMCGNCGGHLGHVFDDGPTPTGQRFCVNSVSIKFKRKDK